MLFIGKINHEDIYKGAPSETPATLVDISELEGDVREKENRGIPDPEFQGRAPTKIFWLYTAFFPVILIW